MKIFVHGHVTTWTIEEVNERFLVKPFNQNIPAKAYGCLREAHRAIRIAETRYVERYPTCPVANSSIWFNHGVLLVNNVAGNYFN